MTIYSPTPFSDGGTIADSEAGSKDGHGCADNDQPYRFGRRPTSAAPFPFTERQYARLLSLRGRVADGLSGQGDLDASVSSTAADSDSESASSSSVSSTLFHACLSCGAMVPGAHQSEPIVLCPRCALAGDRDGVARLILETAGVLGQD